MPSVFSRFILFNKKHPIIRGMISYSLIWPISNLIQQTALGRRWNDYDWWQVFRFSLFGSLYVAPTLYCWIRLAGIAWPKSNFRTAVAKAVVEQLSYTPFAMTSFYFGMSLLELKTLKEAFEEVKVKFVPTYEVAVIVWPFVATFNFCMVPEKNRVPFISACSLCWTCFLAYMKHLEAKEVEEKALIKPLI